MSFTLLRITNQQLENFTNNPTALSAYLSEEESHHELDFGSGFESVHYLVTGNLPLEQEMGNEPRNWAFGTFNSLLEEVEPPFYFIHKITPKEVKEVSQALNNISDTELLYKFDPELFNEEGFWPGDEFWDLPAGGQEDEGTYTDDDDPIAFVTEEFHNLKCFYRKASALNEAVLVFPNGFSPGCNM